MLLLIASIAMKWNAIISYSFKPNGILNAIDLLASNNPLENEKKKYFQNYRIFNFPIQIVRVEKKTSTLASKSAQWKRKTQCANFVVFFFFCVFNKKDRKCSLIHNNQYIIIHLFCCIFVCLDFMMLLL